MAKKERTIITMECTTCGERSYHFTRGRRQEKKLELKKYCKKSNKHEIFKQSK